MKNILYILLIVTIALITSCGNNSIETAETNYDVLTNYLIKEHQFSLNKKIKAIAVISENGGCMNCNKSFSIFISNEIGNPSILFLVCSPGMNIDISPYLDAETNPNILLDQHDKFSDTGLIKKSGVIFIQDESIDTIVEINVESLEQEFTFISNKLNGVR